MRLLLGLAPISRSKFLSELLRDSSGSRWSDRSRGARRIPQSFNVGQILDRVCPTFFMCPRLGALFDGRRRGLYGLDLGR